MSIPRFSAMISTRKVHQNQTNDEGKEFVKTIPAETFGQITNETVNYSTERPNEDSSGKIIQAETFGKITNETDNYNFENPKEKGRYIFGAGNLSDLLKVWPEGNFQSANNSRDQK